MNSLKYQNRNLGLDLLRSIAILMVLVSHGRIFLPEFAYRDDLGVFGFLGVELFFVLSGFLLGSILFKEFALKEYTFKTLKQFWIRRWFRTLPLYFIFLFLNIFVLQYFFGEKNWNWSYFLFSQNLFSSHPSMMPEAWSLSVEEWFYISFPLILFGLLSLFKNKNQGFLILTICYVLIFTIFRNYFAFDQNLDWDVNVRKIVTLRLDSIGYGVLIAYFVLNHKKIVVKYNNKFFIIGVVVILSAIFLFFYFKGTTLNNFFMKSYLFSIVSLGFALIIFKTTNLQIPNNFIRSIITKMSLYSYSAYLVHLSIIIPFFKFTQNVPILTFIIYILSVFFISSYIYIY
ncbi:acyltransferase family protein [Arcobacter sp. s6]|uniref:acyltransferase family protein n=1 Tax=Arcobacter sp. s6 TaxID=3230363 RepID=UPI0034A0AC4C